MWHGNAVAEQRKLRNEWQSGDEIWSQIKAEIAKEMPDLTAMTMREIQVEFERLSQQMADSIPYQSVEEFEHAMRGEVYGLAGH